MYDPTVSTVIGIVHLPCLAVTVLPINRLGVSCENNEAIVLTLSMSFPRMASGGRIKYSHFIIFPFLLPS